MKTILSTALCICALRLFAAEATLSEQSVTWKGAMPASTHTGTLKVSEVHFEDATDPVGLQVVIDMTSIANTDIKKEKNANKLVKHLKSEDFFYVSEYPTASFTVSKVMEDGLQGTLTIRGVEVETTIPVLLTTEGEGVWKLAGTFEFDRHAFGVNYQNAGFFGAAKNKLIADEVEVSIDLTFSTQK